MAFPEKVNRVCNFCYMKSNSLFSLFWFFFFFLAESYANELSRMWPSLLGSQLDFFFWKMYLKGRACVDSLFHTGWTQDHVFFSRKKSNSYLLHEITRNISPPVSLPFCFGLSSGFPCQRTRLGKCIHTHTNVQPREWDCISLIYSGSPAKKIP